MKPETQRTENGARFGLAQKLFAASERVLGITLPSELAERWSELAFIMRTVDDRLDDIADNVTRTKYSERLRAFVHGTGEAAAPNDQSFERALVNLRRLITSLESGRREAFTSALMAILDATEKLRHETNPRLFMRVRREEAEHTAEAFLALLPEAVRNSSRYPMLRSAVLRLGRVANCLDTFIDLSDDYKKGRILLKPSFWAHIEAASPVLREAPRLVSFLTIMLKNPIPKPRSERD
jgi:hypothetical protein